MQQGAETLVSRSSTCSRSRASPRRVAVRPSAGTACATLIDGANGVVRLSETFEDGDACWRGKGAAARRCGGQACRFALPARQADAGLGQGEDAREPGVADRRVHPRGGPPSEHLRGARARRAPRRRARLGGQLRHGLHRGGDRAACSSGCGRWSGRSRPFGRRAEDAARDDAAMSSGSSPSSSARSSSSSGRVRAGCARPSTRGFATTRIPRRCDASGRSRPRSSADVACSACRTATRSSGPRRAHEGRPARVLPPRCTGARAASARPAVHDETLSRRHRRQVLLPEGRPDAHARLDHDRVAAGHDARRQGKAHRSLPARRRRAGAAVGGEHGHDRHERDAVPGGSPRPARISCCSTSILRRRRDSRKASRSRSCSRSCSTPSGSRATRRRAARTAMHVLVPVSRGTRSRRRAASSSLVAGRRSSGPSPGLVTTAFLKEKRRGVLIDANQNREGATIASVYSVRPHPGAPVSTPLRWDELTPEPRSRGLHDGDRARSRVERHGDLFAERAVGPPVAHEGAPRGRGIAVSAREATRDGRAFRALRCRVGRRAPSSSRRRLCSLRPKSGSWKR